jgi:hypothetical protein
MQETGQDYLSLKSEDGTVKVTFADGQLYGEPISKEDQAAFFRGLESKPVAVGSRGSFLAVDFWQDRFTGEVRMIPFPFLIAAIERS